MSQPSDQQMPEAGCQGDVSPSVTFLIQPRAKDLGGFSVSRMLPHRQVRSVGPFIFLDHMGPADFPPGQGIDVRPHPHIGLATITYLFEGEIVHRDSLGCVQAIRPGAINLMIAGRGIVHSERTSVERKASGQRLNGLQMWLALPVEKEEMQPEFHHYPEDSIPSFAGTGYRGRVLVGEAFGVESPVKQVSPTLYLEAALERGAVVKLPPVRQAALYLLKGKVSLEGCEVSAGQLAVLDCDKANSLKAIEAGQIALFGGDPLGERQMYWNLVSSRQDRLEQAKADWREGRFDPVPGDGEFIPLPGE